jgi:ribosome-associated translation inhibitor RaiA
MEHTITYSYIHCTLEELSHDINFDEILFNKKLSKVFETSIRIERLAVIVSKENTRYKVHIEVESPDVDVDIVKKESHEPATAVYESIDRLIHIIHEEKDKLRTRK